MQKCPKCSSQYDDNLKICRTCGAILEPVAEEPPQEVENEPAPPEEDKTDEPPVRAQHSWTCPQCGQSVPGGFEVCWNCGTSEDGVPDPDFSNEAPSDDRPWKQPQSEPAAAATVAALRKLQGSDLLGRKEQIVLLITGHGLKDVDAAMNTIRIPPSIAPTLEAL